MGRFEKEWLKRPEDAICPSSGSTACTGGVRLNCYCSTWISSESPIHGDGEGCAYNGCFGYTCYDRLFKLNQFSELGAIRLAMLNRR